MHVEWTKANHETEMQFSEGGEAFAEAGNGKALPGCSSSYAAWTIDTAIENFVKFGDTNFQMSFGNKGWEPEADFIKKKFEEHEERF